MSGRITTYELSQEADRDLDEIFDYTEAEFGFDRAVAYITQFDVIFEKLLDNPKLGKGRDDIKPGLRSFPKAEHIVFYRILKDRLRIVRVLHGSRDLPRFFQIGY
ncbi:MAG: type II toxin-antitoxin system RelE/ParE family toxin, partial [Cytophagales bacterium]|nr:type II toxin-antitoxin system RelE/ParE family toxin [Cytophagales bacterium]